ncbi:MAG: hypothetical protein ACLFTN_13165, partial [Phycisphaerae bacterium]
MSVKRILIYCEGKNEHGGCWDEERVGMDHPGALPRLVNRLLPEAADWSFCCKPWKNVKAPQGKGPLLARKTMVAMTRGGLDGFDAVVVVMDRDRVRSRLNDLATGRDDSSSDISSPFVPCAVGVAVETFDAWMIVDGGAAKCAGAEGANTHGEPEKLTGKEKSGNHPKDRAEDIFGGGLTEAYSAVAPSVDLDMLRERCPNGFGAFADDVQYH